MGLWLCAVFDCLLVDAGFGGFVSSILLDLDCF